MHPPRPGADRPGVTDGQIRPAPVALGAGGVLVAVALAGRYGPPHAALVAGPVGVVLLLVLARRAGLAAEDVGVGRRSWRRGAAYAAVCVAAVAAVYAVAAALPPTRPAFLDERYQLGAGAAVLKALVWVPVGTVVFEELAFRGVLWGLLCVRRGAVVATVGSAVLFGLWHVGSALRLNEVNPAVAAVVGAGAAGRALAVAGAVGFTAAAGALLGELRRRSGSLLAPIGLHWAVNGIGVLFSAGVAR
jgi:uncharacterized protein